MRNTVFAYRYISVLPYSACNYNFDIARFRDTHTRLYVSVRTLSG